MSGVAELTRVWLDWMLAASWQIALMVCLVGVLTWALRGASPQLRYALWLLVLVKAILPPTLTAFWGIGSWGVRPVMELNRQADVAVVGGADVERAGAESRRVADELPAVLRRGAIAVSVPELLLVVWAVGCVTLWSAVAWRYRRIAKSIGAMRQIDEGPARIELERLAGQSSVRQVPELYTTEQPVSPMLIGVVRPKIVLPESVVARLDGRELRMILAHELAHWRRRDTWVGWLQVLVQGLLWFHPFVWWANARIRHERECACDETVLRDGRCDRDGYGETLLRVLTAARGRSLVMANMVGVFERGSRLQNRLEEIMSFDPTKRKFGWLSRVALMAAALVLLPMAVPAVTAEDENEDAVAARDARKEEGEKSDFDKAAAESSTPAKKRQRTNWPVIVESSPKIGATDVDPKIDEISVTFDRDMDVGGYSWTGGGPNFPTSPEGSTAVWKDKRTCVLPVELKKGMFYRVGINASSFQNFKSELGVPAETTAIYFVTEGGNKGLANRVRVPKVVKSTPEIGATDVDPRLGLITVTFDLAMDPGGFSWTGGGPTFPTIPEGQKPRWSRDGKTCTLPVKLEPGKKYELGLNSVSHKNFASKWGVPLEPVQFEFTTAGEAANGAAENAQTATSRR